jgi:hypothetical protein
VKAMQTAFSFCRLTLLGIGIGLQQDNNQYQNEHQMVLSEISLYKQQLTLEK